MSEGSGGSAPGGAVGAGPAGASRLWSSLYLLVWIVLLDFLAAMIPIWPSVLPWVHLVLGFAVIGIAYGNFRRLRATRVPGRVKRVARIAYQLSVAMAVLGVPLFVDLGASWVLPLAGVSVFHALLFFHIVIGFAILAQAAAVAIAYDMWEDREFAKETLPGEIPEPAFAPPVRSVPRP